MAATWFEDLMGFQERSYVATRANLEVVGTTLRSRINHRSFSIGELETSTITPKVRPARSPQAPPRCIGTISYPSTATWANARSKIDCLRDIGSALDNTRERLWTMRNGYALCTAKGLATIARKLDALDASELDALRDRLRVGLHSGVQVTDAEDAEFVVSQVFCSALPISYTDIPAARWQPFAALVLEVRTRPRCGLPS